MLTKREVFDKVKAHLLKQKVRSINTTTGSCMYRGSDNMQCAVGCLIADVQYAPRLEGNAINIIDDDIDHKAFRQTELCEALSLSGVDVSDEDTVYMLSVLQKVHDKMAPGDWPRLLNMVEKKHFELVS